MKSEDIIKLQLEVSNDNCCSKFDWNELTEKEGRLLNAHYGKDFVVTCKLLYKTFSENDEKIKKFELDNNCWVPNFLNGVYWYINQACEYDYKNPDHHEKMLKENHLDELMDVLLRLREII